MNWLRKWLKGPSAALVNSRSRRRNGYRPQLEALEVRQVPTVRFFGGNLLPHVEAQALYLGNEWAPGTSYSGLTTTVDAFLKDITGSAYMTSLTSAGYGVGTGTASPGFVDTTTTVTPNTVITDSFIQNAVANDISQGGLNPADANSLYIVYVEPNVAVDLGSGQGTTQQGILGYHGAFAGPNGATIRYAVIAYPGGTIGNTGDGRSTIDQLTSVSSHELAEAVTDPDVNFGQLGWYDQRRGEIGDIEQNNASAYVPLDGYLVQEVATKRDQLLTITLPPPMANPTASLQAARVIYHPYTPPTATLTVIITPPTGGATPSGNVNILYQGTVIGTATIEVVNGVAQAQYTVTFTAHGQYVFTAQYVGTGQTPIATSNSVTVFL
jgi:hypothetical protein